MNDRQWQQDMAAGAHASYTSGHCGCGGSAQLRASISKPIDHVRMDRDTSRRTEGRCPTGRGYAAREYNTLAAVVKLTFRSDGKSE